MKQVYAGLAAAFLASAAMAQQVTPVEPPPPPEGMAPPEGIAPPEGRAPPAPGVATLIERDGKWWNGDREATPAEIAAYQKAQKDGRPK
jgi:hypothetical protein